MSRARGAIVLSVVLIFGAAITAIAAGAGGSSRPPAVHAVPLLAVEYAHVQDASLAAGDAQHLGDLVVQLQRDEQARQIVAYVAAVEAEELARARAAQPAISRAPATATPIPTGGGACGGATNGADQYIQRESGGNPYIGNGGGEYASPFDAGRAWGCYQIIPSTWASSCSDITTYDPASQAQCASRLPDSAWALY